jgi:hypothetical protein
MDMERALNEAGIMTSGMKKGGEKNEGLLGEESINT